MDFPSWTIDQNILDIVPKVSGIYKIENTSNNKIYIGQSVNIRERLRQHLNCTAPNTYIDRALQHRDKESFTFSILEQVEIELLNEREYYWGEEYYKGICYYPNGYNLKQVGGNPYLMYGERPVYCYDLNKNFIKEYPSVCAAARSCNISSSNIFSVLRKKTKTAGNYYWSFEKMKVFPDVCTGKNGGFTVHAYNMHTKLFVKSFKSAQDANKYVNGKGGASHILSVAKGEFKTFKGYIWSFIKWDQAPNNYRELNKEYWRQYDKK